MFRKVEHIGIAVKSVEDANQLFARIFGKDSYKEERVEREGVRTSFFQIGETKIEFLEAERAESAIAKFIEKKGEGMHHLAFDVEDIVKEMQRLKAEGFQLLSETPLDGADNKLICFLHPKSTGGILVELCQEKS